MTLRSVALASGSYLPGNVVTNNDLTKLVDTSDEWIVERTGIRTRHIADEGVLEVAFLLELRHTWLLEVLAEAPAGLIQIIVRKK